MKQRVVKLPSKIRIDKKTLELAKKKIYYRNNPIKFIEDCIKIPSPGGSEIIELYEPQKKIVSSFFNSHDLILLKSRQIGMSTLCQAIITYIFTFYENCVVGVLSRDGKESSDFCRKTFTMIDELPDWIRPEYENKSVQYFILTNGCQLHTSAVSPANPGAVFRSKSITLLVIDEAAHIRYIDEAWTGIASTLSKSQQDASRKNIPFGTILLSTPNKTEGIGKWYFDMWVSARKGENNFVPHKIHWSEIPAFANDPDWYKKQCKMLNNDKNKIAQELELMFVGSDSCLFDEHTQIQLQESYSTPIEKLPVPIKRGKGELSKFRDIHRSHFHLIGVDVATVSGKDYSAIEVVEYQTMQQILEFHGKLDPKELTDVIKFVAALCPHNIICVDNQGGYGQSVLYDLLYDEEIEYNLYGRYLGENSTKFQPGLSINTKTRPLILDALHDYISHDPSIVVSERLASELLSLVSKRGDRIEADDGFNDDLALSFAYCCYLRKYCREELGVIDSIPDAEAQKIFTEDTLKVLLSANGGSPLEGIRKYYLFKNNDTIEDRLRNSEDYAKEVDKYVREKVMNGEMGGYNNIFELTGGFNISGGITDGGD